MQDYESLVIDVTKAGSLGAALNEIGPVLPRDMRRRLHSIYLAYLSRYGPEGADERMDRRTIGQIFAEFDASEKPETIASGEVDGVRYELTEQPKRKKK